MVILENIYIQTLLKGFNGLYFYIVCECVCVCVCKTIKVNNKKVMEFGASGLAWEEDW